MPTIFMFSGILSDNVTHACTRPLFKKHGPLEIDVYCTKKKKRGERARNQETVLLDPLNQLCVKLQLSVLKMQESILQQR